MKRILIIGLTLVVMAIAGSGHAALLTNEWTNSVATDQAFFFITEGDVTFDGFVLAPDGISQAPYSIGNISGGIDPIVWTVGVDQPKILSTSGDMFGTDLYTVGHFGITFSDDRRRNFRTNFTMEYALLLDGAIVRTGTFDWARNRGWTRVGDSITSTIPTPIGASSWLLLSGLFGVIGVRRGLRHPN